MSAHNDTSDQPPDQRQIAESVRHLESRAESYWRDAVKLSEDGDPAMAVAYKTIAEELRRVAMELSRG